MTELETTYQIYLPTPDSTDLLGQWLAPHLRAGDTVLLSGDVGAGKTHLARAIIQSRLRQPEDVPSPTFTLIQTYETPEVEIWHADLYRLRHPDELFELGLEDAIGTAICLIEWPDRMGSIALPNAIKIEMRPEVGARKAIIFIPNRPQLIGALRNDWGSAFV